MINGLSISDPMALRYLGSEQYRPNVDPRGRTLRNPTTDAGLRVVVLITAGQSNISNWVGAFYTLSNPTKISNLNIYDGGVYETVSPVLGCDGDEGYWPMRLADSLITGGYCDRVVLVPIAIGATKISSWEPSGQFGDRITVAINRCSALGLPSPLILWQQGEADNSAGTTQAVWSGAFNSMVSYQVSLGNNFNWVVGVSTYSNVTGAVSSAIQAASAAVVNNVNVFAGGNSDTLLGATYRQTGSPHLNATGAAACANLWLNALVASSLV